jgi:hypothetical protein
MPLPGCLRSPVGCVNPIGPSQRPIVAGPQTRSEPGRTHRVARFRPLETGGRACSLHCSTSPCDGCFSSSRSPAAPRSSRSSRSSCSVMSSPSCAARLRGPRFGPPTGRSWPPRAGCSRASAGVRSSSRPTRSCAGIASSWRGAGPTQHCARGDRRSAVRSASWSSDSRARTVAGATSGSRASSGRSDSASRRRRSASSCAKQGSDPLAREPASPGASSSAARRRACSRATSSPSTPSSRHGSTSSSSSSWVAAGSTSRAAPSIQATPGSRSRPASCRGPSPTEPRRHAS